MESQDCIVKELPSKMISFLIVDRGVRTSVGVLLLCNTRENNGIIDLACQINRNMTGHRGSGEAEYYKNRIPHKERIFASTPQIFRLCSNFFSIFCGAVTSQAAGCNVSERRGTPSSGM